MEEIKTIQDFDVNLICEYFLGLERQGPGSQEVTLKALSFIDNLSENSRIADLGCGTGGQTMTLAQHTSGSITCIDKFPGFIDRFNNNARRLGLSNRVKGVVGSMDTLTFSDEELDLIWCEGAIYNIGFERGLDEWRRYLKQGGYVAVSEATWFTNERPEEIERFWLDAGADIDTIAVRVAMMQKSGYLPVATFILPENCWTDNFYTPAVAAQKAFLQKYPGDVTVEEFIASERRGAELYAKYKAYYGYVFYIGKKI